VLAGYIGKNSAVPDAVTEFAKNYAEQNERDYKRFLDAIDSGKIEAKSGL